MATETSGCILLQGQRSWLDDFVGIVLGSGVVINQFR